MGNEFLKSSTSVTQSLFIKHKAISWSLLNFSCGFRGIFRKLFLQMCDLIFEWLQNFMSLKLIPIIAITQVKSWARTVYAVLFSSWKIQFEISIPEQNFFLLFSMRDENLPCTSLLSFSISSLHEMLATVIVSLFQYDVACLLQNTWKLSLRWRWCWSKFFRFFRCVVASKPS